MCHKWLYADAVRDHKVLFRLLYGLSMFTEPQGLRTVEGVNCLANVTAYTEFYGLLESIAEDIEEGLYLERYCERSGVPS